MVDWLSTMQQTFEYYVVDPNTWKDIRKINTVTSSTISRDYNAETLGSATFNMSETLGECYIRIYLITIQNGIKEKHPLGTFLVQTPSFNFDGKTTNIRLDAYTPLLELKESPPPIGYSILKDANIMENAYMITREYVRAPVNKATSDKVLYRDFVANTSDTWITFIYDLLANADYTLDLDEMGRVLFAPIQDTASLQPVWTYNDDNSSILFPSLDIEHDLYGIPNVVEVVYSNGLECYTARVENKDTNSPISIPNRGREIIHRVMNPDIPGIPSDLQLETYARQTLRNLSSLEYTVSYTHGYCPVRIGDCVRLNYERAGLKNVKAKVISQSIECTPGCPVTEKAVYTMALWRG